MTELALFSAPFPEDDQAGLAALFHTLSSLNPSLPKVAAKGREIVQERAQTPVLTGTVLQLEIHQPLPIQEHKTWGCRG